MTMEDIAMPTTEVDLDSFVNSIYHHRSMWICLARRWTYPHGNSAEDCLQEALLHATKGWSSWRGDSSIKTWFGTILHNCCREFIRRHHARIEGHSFQVEMEEVHCSLRQESGQMLVIRWVDLEAVAYGKRRNKLKGHYREMLELILANQDLPKEWFVHEDGTEKSTGKIIKMRTRQQLERLGLGR